MKMICVVVGSFPPLLVHLIYVGFPLFFSPDISVFELVVVEFHIPLHDILKV